MIRVHSIGQAIPQGFVIGGRDNTKVNIKRKEVKIMRRVLCIGFILGFVLLTVISTQAAYLDAPVPSNAYITYNGLDWAWASPCSGAGCSIH